MVNIGGRSRGCSTCRRRRVKCDENRPICRRCQRCGLQCTGPRDITFVEGNIVRSRRSAKSATGQGTGNAVSTDRQIRPSVPLLGNKPEIYICYAWKKYLRRGGIVDLVMQETDVSDIIAAGSSAGSDRIFHQAILSFATLVFGSQHGQADVVRQGYVLHGVALKQLNLALSDSRCYTRDDIILSVITLALLECLAPTGPKHYLEHMIGLERLLELRDPASDPSPNSSALYKSVRHMILFASLRTRKASILARTDWKTALRAHCSDQDMQEQDLYDVLADCTALTAEHDSILASWNLHPETSERQRETLAQRALTLRIQLFAWRERWDSDGKNSYAESPRPLTRIQPKSDTSVHGSPPFPTAFEFSNDSTAVMLMFYHTTLLYVLQILASLDDLDIHTEKGFIQNPLQGMAYQDNVWECTNNQYRAAERSAALQIFRCIPYYVDRISRFELEPSPIVHWAATTAWTTLRGQESAAGRWIMGLLGANRGAIAQALWSR